MLRLLQKHGHRPVVLMGGGTTRIGDPSGKDESRQLLSDAQIAANMAGIRRVLRPVPDVRRRADRRDDGQQRRLARRAGLHPAAARRRRALHRQPHADLRLGQAAAGARAAADLPRIQLHDPAELRFPRAAPALGVTLQMGGSDQWGNIVSGVELVRRTDAAQVFGLTTPLITTASGAKMGKSAQGAVWLTADRLSPYDYWQFWRNTEDADVGRFLRLFTDLPLAEIARLEALGGAEINEAKKVLATEATALAHGRAAAEAAAETARRAFEEGEAAESLPSSRCRARNWRPASRPSGCSSAPAWPKSGGEARRLIRGGGARVNDEAVTDEAQVVSLADLRGDAIKLSAGRKQHRLVRAG